MSFPQQYSHPSGGDEIGPPMNEQSSYLWSAEIELIKCVVRVRNISEASFKDLWYDFPARFTVFVWV